MSILVIIGDTLKFLLGKILNFLNIDDADGNEARHEHWVKSEDGTLYDCFDDTGAIDIDIPDSDETPS